MYMKPSTHRKILFKFIGIILVFGLVFSSLGTGQSRAAGSSAEDFLAPLIYPSNAEVIPNQYIVVYKNGFNADQEQGIRSSVAAYGGSVQYVYNSALNGFSAYLPDEALTAVLSDPAVKYVEADAVVSLDLPEENLNLAEDFASELETDEISSMATQINATWGLDRVDQKNLPLSTTYFYNNQGTNVHVYVIDTGIRSTHSEFGNRAVKNFDAFGLSGDDCNGHGTHVAGTIGGKIYGIAKNVRLHGVRVLDCGGFGSYSGVIAGVDWVAANRIKPAVANLSLGGPTSAALDSAINKLINNGVVVVIAAGNNDSNACFTSPARVPKAITVGSTTSTDARSSFSNWGKCLDIFAPGSLIKSAWYTSNSATNTISGTSMAAPHVAGVAALYLQIKPTASVPEVTAGILNATTKSKVTSPGSQSPNRLLFSRHVVKGVAISPSGVIMDTTPTFKWRPIFGATLYRMQVYRGSNLLYTKTVQPSACSVNACLFTPASPTLIFTAHKWRVQARVDGVWKTYSEFRLFDVVP